ncbi:MAG: hypothetical protein PVJ39_19710 [Gammaproteobacteria bacterium]
MTGLFLVQQLLNSAATQFACQLPESVLYIPQWFNHIWLLDDTRSILTCSVFHLRELDTVAAINAALLLYVISDINKIHRIIFKTNASRDAGIALERSIP